MPYYLLLTRSITHAQRMSSTLTQAGIPARYFRPPVGLTGRGCGYAVHVSPLHVSAAMTVLRNSSLQPVRVMYTPGDGTFSEVTLS